ncbi:hypothetical protein MMC17_010164 [Xylographa soralifera]|nr:hypothetical protein [Xylographa soralifera]
MEDRQADHRHRRHKRQRSYSRERPRRLPDSDRDSYQDRDRREDSSLEEERNNRPPRTHYSRNSRSRSPYRPHSQRQRSASPNSPKSRKRLSLHYEEGQHSSNRRRSSTSHSHSLLQAPLKKSNRSPLQPKRSQRRSHSPHHELRKYSPSSVPKANPFKRSEAPLPSQQAAFKDDHASSSTTLITTEKQKPNFAPSGLLAAETNTVSNTTIILKYNEPPETRLPSASAPWRLYVFKGLTTIDTLPLHTRSCWLFGRESAVVDYVTEHPSCSKQHAVVQFRYVEKKDEFGERVGGVKPYVLDLESANGTWVNGEVVPERRYVELMSGDVVKFGESTREYVLILPPKE